MYTQAWDQKFKGWVHIALIKEECVQGKAEETCSPEAEDMSRHIAATNCNCSYVKPTGALTSKVIFIHEFEKKFLGRRGFLFMCSVVSLLSPTANIYGFATVFFCCLCDLHQQFMNAKREIHRTHQRNLSTPPIPFTSLSWREGWSWKEPQKIHRLLSPAFKFSCLIIQWTQQHRISYLHRLLLWPLFTLLAPGTLF